MAEMINAYMLVGKHEEIKRSGRPQLLRKCKYNIKIDLKETRY
jgi:hypothetical protein